MKVGSIARLKYGPMAGERVRVVSRAQIHRRFRRRPTAVFAVELDTPEGTIRLRHLRLPDLQEVR